MGKVSLNAIVSSILSSCASRASLSATVAAGRRRQQRFLWLRRQTGNSKTLKDHRGGESGKKAAPDRGSRLGCITPTACMWHRYSKSGKRHTCMLLRMRLEKKKKELQRNHTREREQSILHAKLKDFQLWVNRASYCSCALKMTEITDHYICVHPWAHPSAFLIPIQTTVSEKGSRTCFFFPLLLLTGLNKLTPAASVKILQKGAETYFSDICCFFSLQKACALTAGWRRTELCFHWDWRKLYSWHLKTIVADYQ